MATTVATIQPIVGGHGEVKALGVLLRRLAAELAPDLAIRVLHPIRRSEDRLKLDGELEKDVDLAAECVEPPGCVFILLDCEDECPGELGPALTVRAREARPDMRVHLTLARREYETWFVAAAASLAEHGYLQPGTLPPADPESIRGAKEWLAAHTARGTYSETIDQAKFSACFDLEQARRVNSFKRLRRVCETMFHELRTGPAE